MKKRVRRTDIVYIRVHSVEDIDFNDPVVREKLARTYTNFLTRNQRQQEDTSSQSNAQSQQAAGESELP